MKCIVAVDNNWAIGLNNKTLVSIPADMRFFKSETTNKVVIMGKNTLESFPAGMPLKNRTNIVITHKENYKVPGAIIVHSIEEALDMVKDYDTDDVYVIGGAKIYEQMLKYCDVVHVTKIDFEYNADTYFPNLDNMPEWHIECDSEEQTYYDLEYRFLKYVKK
ncbi:MAG: dihydrofolate reductase [Lachnospiraceae bacterium]|nr:dihydrofolate reductase [Lachnospiraceae bacterium]